MEIRHTKPEDLKEIMGVYQCAREYMVQSGNPTQWAGGYPPQEQVEEDIRDEMNYVVTEEGKIHGVFVFFQGDDEAYHVIDGGQWKNEEPYGVVHRIASDGEVHGVFSAAINFAKSQCDNLRIDTHEDNKTMQHLLTKAGFSYCGTIYVRNHAPRRAYHYVK